MTRRDYWLHLEHAEACLTSAVCALRLALRCIAAGDRAGARTWLERADSSVSFAAALLAWASSGSALAALRRAL